jgi:hypothetical protein
MEKDQSEKEALAALLKALASSKDEEEEPMEKSIEIEIESEPSTSEEVESELEDGEDIESDSEDSLEEDYEDEKPSLKELVKSFMNESSDPFSDKKGMGMGMEKEMMLIKPLKKMIKKRRK